MLSLLLAVPLAAQSAPTSLVPDGDPAAISRGGAGLTRVDGTTWALGDGWKAELRPEEVEFTPALGSRVATNRSLTWSVESIARGGEVVWTPGPAAAPSLDGSVARYARGGGVVERWTVTPEGLELAFELPSELGTDGDLVVRGRLTSALESDDGLSAEPLTFRLGPDAAARIGTVTAIDADGRRAGGELERRGQTLDLIVPDAFLDGATWPLVVDPLFTGANFTIDGDGENPEVAFDPLAEHYLVTWTTRFSLLDTDVRGRFVDVDGTVDAGLIPIATDGFQSFDSAVGFNAARQNFFVAYTERDSLFAESRVAGRTVESLAPHTVGGELLIADPEGYSARTPDVGGSRGFDSDVAVVWAEHAEEFGRVKIARIIDSAQLQPLIVTLRQFYSGGSPKPSNPSILAAQGDGERRMVAFDAIDPFQQPNGRSIVVMGLDIHGQAPFDDLFSINLSPPDGLSYTAPRIAGRAEDSPLTIVFERSGDALGGFAFSQAEYASDGSGASLLSAQTYLHGGPFGAGDVGWSGYDAVTFLTDEGGLDDLHLRAIDLLDGSVSNVNGLPGTLYPGSGVAVAMEAEITGAPSHRGLAVWAEAVPITGAKRISAKRLTPGVGVDDLGGGCGADLTVERGLPTLGQDISFRLTGMPPGVPVLHVLGFARVDFACGGCTLVPSTAGGLIHATTTSFFTTSASVSYPIPADPVLTGLSMWTQWYSVDLVDPACALFSVDAADAAELTVGPLF